MGGGGETVASAGKPRMASAESTQRLKLARAKLEADNAFAEQAVARSAPSSSASGRGAHQNEEHAAPRVPRCNQTIYRMNNGMSYIPYAEQPKAVPPRFGQPSPAFSEESVRKRLAEVDKPPPARMQMLSSEQSSGRDGEAHPGSQKYLPPRTGPVSYQLDTFARFLQDPRRESSLTVAGITNKARMTRKMQQEEARARKKASRMERQLAADQARVAYGLTSKEKKERQKRTERLAQQAFDVAQIAAGRDYKMRSKRVFLANTASLIAQIIFVLDVYQSKQPSSRLPGGMEPAPRFVFIYTMCGILGSGLALMSITVLSAILASEGLKSPSLQKICPLIVKFQYLSAFLQLQSLFNHIGYLPNFFQRLTKMYPAEQAWYTALLIGELVVGPIIPLLLIFTILQTKQMCYKVLQYIVPASLIHKHIYLAIMMCQVLSGVLTAGLCTLNLANVVSSVQGAEAGRSASEIAAADKAPQIPVNDTSRLNSTAYTPWSTSTPSQALFVNYLYFAYPIVGVLGMLLGIFYGFVTMKMTAYAKEVEDIDARLADARLAGQRPMVQKGNECCLCHLVDKPRFDGALAIIQSDGPDDSGFVVVLVEGQEIKVEEFQLTIVASPEEFQSTRTMAGLRAADLLYQHEKKGTKITLLQIAYVVLGQVLIGYLTMGVVFLLSLGKFNALAVYREIVRQALKSQGNLLKYQSKYCSKWARCIDTGLPNPAFCGTCVINKPAAFSIPKLRRGSFSAGNLFSGRSLVALIIFSSIGFGFGLMLGVVLTCMVAKTKRRVVFSTSLLLAILFAIIGAAACVLPEELVEFSPLTKSECDALDIDESKPGIQVVEQNCVLTVAAYSVKEQLVDDSQLSVTGCLVNNFAFLFESLSFLATSIRARGPNSWAKFEALVFLGYFIIVALTMLGGNAVYTFTNLLEIVDKIYEDITLFGELAQVLFGEGFPLLFNQVWAFERQNQLGKTLWFNFSLACPAFIVVIIIQFVNISIALFTKREIVWIRSIRAILVFDTLLILSLYASIGFFSLSAVNFTHNVLAISVIPLCVQFMFAMLYSIQSDIIPIYADMPANPVLATFVRLIWLVPPAALLIFVVGLSFYVFFGGAPSTGFVGTRVLTPEQYTTTGFALMFAGGGVLFLFAAGLAVVFIRVVGQYAEDWQQMMIYELQVAFGWKIDNKYDPNAKVIDAEQAGGRADESADSATASRSSEDADDNGLKT